MSTETMSPDVIVTTNSLQTVESAPAFTAVDEATWLDEDKDVSVKTGDPALTEEEHDMFVRLLTAAVEDGVAAETQAKAEAEPAPAAVEPPVAEPVAEKRSGRLVLGLGEQQKPPQPRKRVPHASPEAAAAAATPRRQDKQTVRGETLKDGLKKVRKSLWHTGLLSDQEHSTTLVAREVHDTMLEVHGGGVFIRDYLPSDMLVPEAGEILLTPTPVRQDVVEKCRRQKQQLAEFYGYVVMHRVGQRFQYRLMAVPEGMEQGRKPPISTHVRRIMLLGTREEIQKARAFQLYTRKARNADGESTLVFAFAVH